MALPASHGSQMRNKRNKRNNPQRSSRDPPPLFALFASFATRSSGEPPLRRSPARVPVLPAFRPAGLQKECQGPTYALGANVALEEVGYLRPAHTVSAGAFEGRVDGVGYRVPRCVTEDLAGAVFRLLQ